MRLFHITYRENIPSIMANGLLPSIGERARLVDETTKKISCFESLDKAYIAYDNWMCPLFNNNKQIVVIELDVKPYDVKKDGLDYPVFKIIEPSRICKIYTLNNECIFEQNIESFVEQEQKTVAQKPKLKF